jgi:hypothetical protein
VEEGTDDQKRDPVLMTPRSLPTRFEIVGQGMSAFSVFEKAASSSGTPMKSATRPQNQ